MLCLPAAPPWAPPPRPAASLWRPAASAGAALPAGLPGACLPWAAGAAWLPFHHLHPCDLLNCPAVQLQPAADWDAFCPSLRHPWLSRHAWRAPAQWYAHPEKSTAAGAPSGQASALPALTQPLVRHPLSYLSACPATMALIETGHCPPRGQSVLYSSQRHSQHASSH